MRYKELYIVYPRTLKSGKKVFYYQTYDEYGKRTNPRSTGQLTKTAARYYCDKLKKEGKLIPKKNKIPTFKEYTKNWFVWGKCPYITSKIARGGTHTRGFADDRRTYLTKHVLPMFGKYRLNEINPRIIENWQKKLLEEKKSVQSINHYYGVLRLVLNEAYRLGDIEKNPCERVKPFIINTKTKKGTFSDTEVKKLFGKDCLEKVWCGQDIHYLINLIGYKTGMRIGEILALRPEDILQDKIIVKHNYHKVYGLKPTKSNRERIIPIDSNLYRKFLEHKMKYGISQAGFLFSSNGGEKPITQSVIRKYFIKACQNIKIKDEQRKERNLSFHSWRHALNTRLLESGLPGELVREITGHSDKSMTRRYAHIDGTRVQGLSEAMKGVI